MSLPTYRTSLSICAGLIATATNCSSIAQTWTTQSPYPANDDLTGVYFVNESVGYVTGLDNILMKTTDGGQTWSQAGGVLRDPSGIGYTLEHVRFTSETHGLALGGRAYRTVDGGQTWQELAPPLVGSVVDFDCLTTQRCFAWGNRGMMTTSNGGNSWTENIPYDVSSNFIYDADFFSENLAVLVGKLNGQYGVWRSTNGGTNWQIISNNSYKRVVYLTSDVLLAATGTTIFRSTNGGTTWTSVYSDFDPQSQADVEEIARIDADSVAAIGFDGRIWISNDQGLSWSRVKEPSGNWGFGCDIHFPTAQTGYAAGRLGLIHKSTDGGQTWTQISSGGARPMFDIVMRPNGLGLAVGEDGTVLRTTDFGQHWTARQILAEGQFAYIGDLETIEFADDDTVYVGGDFSIYRSDDAGLTWTLSINIGGNAEVRDMYFFNENEGFACGILNAPRGFIDYTNDGGQTWQRRFDGEPYPVKLHMFDSANGRALILSATNLFTEDAFVSNFWFTLPGDWARYHMEYGSDTVGWYVGPTANLLKTSDAGLGFEAQTLPGFSNNGGVLSDWLTDLRVLSPTKAYVSTYVWGNPSPATFYVTNDGSTWTTLNPILEPARMDAGVIHAFDVFDSGEIWATGGDGYIFNSGIPSPSRIGDLDNDDVVDVNDLFMLLSAFGTDGPGADLAAPMNIVDVADLFQLLANWG